MDTSPCVIGSAWRSSLSRAWTLICSPLSTLLPGTRMTKPVGGFRWVQPAVYPLYAAVGIGILAAVTIMSRKLTAVCAVWVPSAVPHQGCLASPHAKV